MKSRWTLWFIIIITVLSLYLDIPKLPQNATIPGLNVNVNDYLDKFPLKLGLDLLGGTQLVLQADMSKVPVDQQDDALESAKNVIERRVNQFGVSEAVVQTSKLNDQRRIIVELPGIKDASAAAQLVGKTAELEFRELPASPSAEATISGEIAIMEAVPTGLSGADLKRAQVTFDSSGTGEAQVSLEFNDAGSKKFAEITRRNLGRQLPIFLDGLPISAPVVQQEIIGGTAVINGSFTSQTAKDLAIQLNAGALPVPVKIIDQHSVGASLGQESIQKSLIAGLIGLGTLLFYMAIYYGRLGLIADLALLIYTLLTLAIFKTGLFIMPPITLTLAGIAGFVLSIGMAVDANILIFERMKEERRWGKSSAQALELGFKRAWTSIRDSNFSTLMTAAILFAFGSGTVQGFAITLAIGVLVSMFTAYTVTKTLLRLLIR